MVNPPWLSDAPSVDRDAFCSLLQLRLNQLLYSWCSRSSINPWPVRCGTRVHDARAPLLMIAINHTVWVELRLSSMMMLRLHNSNWIITTILASCSTGLWREIIVWKVSHLQGFTHHILDRVTYSGCSTHWESENSVLMERCGCGSCRQLRVTAIRILSQRFLILLRSCQLYYINQIWQADLWLLLMLVHLQDLHMCHLKWIRMLHPIVTTLNHLLSEPLHLLWRKWKGCFVLSCYPTSCRLNEALHFVALWCMQILRGWICRLLRLIYGFKAAQFF